MCAYRLIAKNNFEFARPAVLNIPARDHPISFWTKNERNSVSRPGYSLRELHFQFTISIYNYIFDTKVLLPYV